MVQNHRRQQLSSDEQQDEFIHFLVSHGAGPPSYLWDARVRRLRGERKFPSLDALREEVMRNAQQTRDYFAPSKAQ